MSPRDLAFVGCRLLALYFVYVSILTIPQGLFAFSSAFGVSKPSGVQLFYEASFWLVLASPILGLAMALLLWFGAGWISREVAEGVPDAAPEWSPRSLLSVGVVLLGLVLVSFALPQIALYLLYIADGAMEATDFQVSYLISEVVQVVIGIGFVLGSQAIARYVGRVRRWSPDRS